MTEKDGANPQSPNIEPLGKKHDRVAFSCGDDALDTYLKRRASQEAKKNIAAPFVMGLRLGAQMVRHWEHHQKRLMNLEESFLLLQTA